MANPNNNLGVNNNNGVNNGWPNAATASNAPSTLPNTYGTNGIASNFTNSPVPQNIRQLGTNPASVIQ